jgi:hypothetical protein
VDCYEETSIDWNFYSDIWRLHNLPDVGRIEPPWVQGIYDEAEWKLVDVPSQYGDSCLEIDGIVPLGVASGSKRGGDDYECRK